MSKERDEQLVLANAYLEEGKHLIMQNQIRDAEKLLMRAKEIFSEQYDAHKYAITLNALGVIYNAMDDDLGCISCYLEGMTSAKDALNEIDDSSSEEYRNLKSILGTIYNNIGSRYLMNEAYERALEYFAKAEELIDSSKIQEDISIRRTAHIIFLNFTECYGQLNRFDEAWESLNKAKELMLMEDENFDCFSYLILEFQLRASTGQIDYVKEHVDELIEESKNVTDATDYMIDMRAVCSLLSRIDELDYMKEVILVMEKHIEAWQSTSYNLFVVEMWMNYYRLCNDEENHLKMCKEYAYLTIEERAHNHKVRADVIDIRMAFLENEEKRLKATEQFHRDSLTGVGNRDKLKNDIEEKIPMLIDEQKSIGVGLIDIDYFKQQNDTYGHLKGDECLKTVATIIRDVIKNQGDVYRFGGDEFVVIIEDVTRDKIKNVAETIMERLHHKAIPNINSSVLPEVTLSQGYVCIYPKQGDSFDELMAIADKSLYHVKESGRNGYYVI